MYWYQKDNRSDRKERNVAKQTHKTMPDPVLGMKSCQEDYPKLVLYSRYVGLIDVSIYFYMFIFSSACILLPSTDFSRPVITEEIILCQAL